jgi:O-antigen/teichoic acid export membrane protein
MPSPEAIEHQSKAIISLKDRLLRSWGANAFGQVVTVIIQLVSVPVFIQFWDVELYGDWLILFSIPSYFALSDLGFGQVAANEMTMLVARGDRSKALSIFQSTWLLMCTISFAIVLLLSTVTWFIPVEDLLNLSVLGHRETVCIILTMVIHILISQQGGLVEAGFRCEGNYALGTFYANTLRLSEFGAVTGSVCMGATPANAAFIFLFVRLCGVVYMWLSLHKRYTWIDYGYAHASLLNIKQLSTPAIAFMGYPLGYALSIQGMTIVVGTSIGSEAVVIFSTLRTLSRLAWQLLNTISYAVQPELSTAFGSGNLQLACKLHRHSCQVSLWLTLATVAGLSMSGEWLLSIWTNGAVHFQASLFYIMLLVIVANSLWSTSQMVSVASNMHQKVACIFAISTLFSLCLAKWLIPVWGLPGAAASLLIVDILMFFYVLRSSLILSQDRLLDFLRVVITPPVRLLNSWK